MAFPSILDYSSLQEFLRAYLKFRRRELPHFNSRRLAKELGIRSPALISMVLNGRRRASEPFVQKLGEHFGWSPRELDVCFLLNGLTAAKGRQRQTIYKRLRAARAAARNLTLDASLLEQLHWYDIVISEMIDLEDFHEDPTYISERLGRQILPEQAQDAIARLLHAGVLTRDAAGILRRGAESNGTVIKGKNGRIQTFHRTMLALAENALTQQPVDKRFFSGTTLTIDEKGLAEVEPLMKEVVSKLIAAAYCPRGKETYQFSMQFFSLTSRRHVQGAKA